MNRILFSKYQAAGNDFVIIDNRDGKYPLESLSALAPCACHRRFGIGADGILVIEKSSIPSAVARMRVINADGSLAQMCGNGLRCVTRWLDEAGLIAGCEANIESGGGLQYVRLLHKIDEKYSGWKVEITLPFVRIGEETDLVAMDSLWHVATANVGNPHAVIEVTENAQETMRRIGNSLEHHPWFPEGTNVEVFQRLEENAVQVFVHERGVGETLACGTGAVATAAIFAHRYGLRGNNIRIMMPGGELSVFVPEFGEQGFRLCGDAVKVFEGFFG